MNKKIMLLFILLMGLSACKNHCDIAREYCGLSKTAYVSPTEVWCSVPQEFFCYDIVNGEIITSELLITEVPVGCGVSRSQHYAALADMWRRTDCQYNNS